MDVKIDQTAGKIKIVIDGLDITDAVRGFTVEKNTWERGTRIHLDLAIDEIEVTALAEQGVTIMVGVSDAAAEALQAIGWIKTSDRTSYTVPREELNA